MPRWRPALLALVPGVVLMQNWLRLEDPQRDVGLAFLLLLIAAAPALAPRLWQRLVLLAIGTIVAIDLAVHVPLLHPWRAESRLWNGFLDFYEVRLPFNPAFHPGMHALLLLAGFGFTAAVALAAASRRPVAAVAFLVVGAGWPATLLSDGHDLLRGGVILATALFLLAGLRTGASRALARAALLGGALVVAALAATTQPAVAKSEFLHWQTWNPHKRPPESVGVRYVWDANYDGFRWPRKTTPVLKIKASARSVYWRATTLDVYDGTRWIEQHTPIRPHLFDGHLDLTQDDPLAATGARDPANWQKVDVEVESLADNHVVAPSVPVAYGLDFGGPEFWQGGTATLPRELERGDQYTAFGYAPTPTPAQLAAAKAAYPGGSDSLPRGVPRRERPVRVRHTPAGLRHANVPRDRQRRQRTLREGTERRRRYAEPVRCRPGARVVVPEHRRVQVHDPTAAVSIRSARRLRSPHEARLLPAFRGRDGSDAALPRHPRARGRGIRERHVRRRYAHVDGDRPRRACVGRGLVSALRLAAVRPDAGARLPVGGLFGVVPAVPCRVGREDRRRRRSFAPEHGSAPPGRQLRRQGRDVRRHGHPAREPVARRSVRNPASRRQPRQARRVPARARGRARRADQGGSQAPALRDA